MTSQKLFRWLSVFIVIGSLLCIYLSFNATTPQNWDEAKTRYETPAQEGASSQDELNQKGKSEFQQRLERARHEHEERQRL